MKPEIRYYLMIVLIAAFFLSGCTDNQAGKAFDVIGSQAFSSDFEQDLYVKNPISSFKISADLKLNSEASLVRIILVDNENNEYLVYEAYPAMKAETKFSIKDECEETCSLPGIIPTKLKVNIIDAELKINSYSAPESIAKEKLSKAELSRINTQAAKTKEAKENAKVIAMNQKKLGWTAGKTSVSHLTYQEKKKLFSNQDGTPVEFLPNLQGFEYYKGGIFEIKDTGTTDNSERDTSDDRSLPDSWDWRNVHGENWMTPVKNQGAAGTCWAHATIGALESQMNLYYNQHLDVDLSEQMLVDCITETNLPDGLHCDSYESCSTNDLCNCSPGSYYCTISQHGISEESCDPYVAREPSNPSVCSIEICNDWQDRVWKNHDFYDYDLCGLYSECPQNTLVTNEDELKSYLIQKGPMSSSIISWNHAMALVGFSTGNEWKVIDGCIFDNTLCHPQLGCIPKVCSNPGDEMTICVNAPSSDYNSLISQKMSYLCVEDPRYGGLWTLDPESYSWCDENERCVDNECASQDLFNLVEGHTECANQRCFGTNCYFMDYIEYSPEQNSPYWIFKNSGGTGFGENGYARVMVSLENMAVAGVPLGPFTPPTNTDFWPSGFTNQIRCVDNDNDGYCNWGISEEKPDTCPSSCKEEKDCDDSDPVIIKDCELDIRSCQEGDSQPCTIQGLNGRCSQGMRYCEDETWQPCEQTYYPGDEICENGEDDDCDGKTDVEDADCYQTNNTIACNDDIDNDGDDLVDLADPGCESELDNDEWNEATNNPPTAEILSPGDGMINIGYTVSFTGQGTDPDDGDYIIKYVWSYNNIDFSNEQNPTFTFPEQGSYIITLEVEDNHYVYSEPDSITIHIMTP